MSALSLRGWAFRSRWRPSISACFGTPGLSTSTVDGKRRVYRLAEDPLPAVLAWVTPYHRKWSASLDRLSNSSPWRAATKIDEEQS